MANRQNILIIKHGALGDLIQSEGALRDIRANHPDALITVLTEPAYARIMARCPWVDEIVKDPRAPRWRLDLMWSLRSTLRALKPDMIYDLQNSSRTADYYRWFFKDTPWSGTAPGCSHPHRAKNPKSIHSLKRMEGQLKDAGLTCRHTLTPDLSWLADDVSALLGDANLKPGYILLIPGSSAAHPQKRWPYYRELAEKLMADGHQVATAPGPDELDLCAGLPATMLTGGSFLGWFDLAGVIAKAGFIIGNDTGPSHIAAHMGKPGLALFGSHTSVEKTGIRTHAFDAIEVTDLKDLSPDHVLANVRERLKAHSNSV